MYLKQKKDLPAWFRWFIDNSNIGPAYRDHERQEILLQETDLDWTIVRPVGLTNAGPKPVKVSIDNNPGLGLTISRRSVADFMVKEVEKRNYVRSCPTISS